MNYEIYIKEIADVNEANRIPIAYCNENNILFEFINEQFIGNKIRLCINDINEIIININNLIQNEYNYLNYCDIKLQRVSELKYCIAQLDLIKHIIDVLHEKDKHVLMIRQIR